MAFQAFSSSGVTPRVLADGSEQGRQWVLVEFVDGEPVMSPTDGRDPVDSMLDATDPVLRALKQLPVTAAPATAQAAAIDSARRMEYAVLQRLQLPETGPNCFRTAQTHWLRPRLLHGDLVPVNVIRSARGVRLIDLAGGYGPVEADAGRWLAAVFGGLLHRGGTIEDAATTAGRILDAVVGRHAFLDRTALADWTSSHLAQYAITVLAHGVPLPEARAIGSLGGRLELYVRQAAAGRAPGRNELCPCGTGKKFKHCCGAPGR